MRVLGFAGLVCLVGVASPAPRELVYAYAFESNRIDDADKAYGVDKMDPQGGGTFIFHNVNQHYRSPTFNAPQSRTGKIVVQILREESDGGLVLHVSEGSALAISADPVTCVAFGDTTVVCDPNHAVTPEITVLLGLLGKGFVDASHLDAARHWRTEPPGAYGTTAEYTIVRTAGALLEVNETGLRTRSGSPLKTTIGAKIEYDAARSIPISVDESTAEQDRRGTISESISTHTLLKLESDSPSH